MNGTPHKLLVQMLVVEERPVVKNGNYVAWEYGTGIHAATGGLSMIGLAVLLYTLAFSIYGGMLFSV